MRRKERLWLILRNGKRIMPKKKKKPSDKGIHRSKKVYLSFYNDSLVCKIKINCVTLEVIFQIWLICIGILMC